MLNASRKSSSYLGNLTGVKVEREAEGPPEWSATAKENDSGATGPLGCCEWRKVRIGTLGPLTI